MPLNAIRFGGFFIGPAFPGCHILFLYTVFGYFIQADRKPPALCWMITAPL
jgi:hypothetical protein